MPDPATGDPKRQRVRLGHLGTISLAEACDKVTEAREAKRAEVHGVALTVKQLADSYRHDRLQPNRETADEVWQTIRVHILEAKPDPRRPAFGEWAAMDVRPLNCAAVVRAAKEPRVVENRRRGGPVIGGVVLRELKSIFEHGVNTGALMVTPAGTLKKSAFGLGSTDRDRVLNENELKAFFDAVDLSSLLDGTAKPRRASPTVRLALAFQAYLPLRSQSLIGAR